MRPRRGDRRAGAQVRSGGCVHPRRACSSCAAGTGRARTRTASRPATAGSDRADDDPHRGRAHAPARRARSGSSSTRGRRARRCCSTSRAGTSTGRARTCSRAGAGAARETSSASPAATTSTKRTAGEPRRSEDAALRPLGRGDDRRDVPGHRPGHASLASPAPCGSSSSRRCIPAPTTPISARSSPRSSTSSSPAATSSSARSSTGESAGGRRHVEALPRRRDCGAAASTRTSCTRTSSCPRALAAALASGRRSSSPRTARTSRTPSRTPPFARATRYVVRRAAHVIAVSAWLRDRLAGCGARGGVQDDGGRLRRRPRAVRAPLADEARAEVRVAGGRGHGVPLPRLAQRAEERPAARAGVRAPRRGELTFVGDGPLRRRSRADPGIRLVGRVRHDEVPRWIAAADVVCQPSLVEPFGLATLEAMASARSVVATRVGGPPEFVPPEAACSSTPRTRRRSSSRSTRRRRFRARTRRPARRRSSHTTSGGRRSGWRSLLERAARGRRA